MATALAVPVVEAPRPLPRSLWVAVAASDAAAVAERVSQALLQAPGLRLQAGDVLQGAAERERALAACDAMLLCWSLAAVTDSEVIRTLRQDYEYQQRLQQQQQQPNYTPQGSTATDVRLSGNSKPTLFGGPYQPYGQSSDPSTSVRNRKCS